jgi:hypothetical protein
MSNKEDEVAVNAVWGANVFATVRTYQINAVGFRGIKSTEVLLDNQLSYGQNYYGRYSLQMRLCTSMGQGAFSWSCRRQGTFIIFFKCTLVLKRAKMY